MSEPIRLVPWRKPAPRLLPYVKARVVDGTLQTTTDDDAYQRDLQNAWLLPTEDLKELWYRYRELVVEISERLADDKLEPAERQVMTDSHDVAMLKVEQYATELERRKRIAQSGHPLAPPHDSSRRDELVDRIRAVKATWPIDQMVTQLMGVELRSVGREHFVGLCPIHLEKTPSFHVYANAGRFQCYGCGEGGDILDLIGYRLGLSRPAEQLDALERWASTGLAV